MPPRVLSILAFIAACASSSEPAATGDTSTSTATTGTTTGNGVTSTPDASDGPVSSTQGSSSSATTTGDAGDTTGGEIVCDGDPHTPGGPDAWGGCWPGPNNTGVPPGTMLTPYRGPCTITEDGTVIDAKTIECDLVIMAADVEITRSSITGSVATDEESTGYSFRIADSDVDVGDRPGTGVGSVNFVAERVHVTGGNRSMHCWHDCTIVDSYVHGQYEDGTGTSHESGMRMGQSATIRHNAIICDAPDVPPDGGCSADLTGYGDFAPVQNNTIDRNLFGATTGGYCTYGGSTAGKPFSDAANHIVFTDNVWQRGTNASDHGEFVCGYYGSNTGFDPGLPGNVWTGNRFDDETPVEPAG